MDLKIVPPKRMTPKIKTSLLMILRPSDYGCRNTPLPNYLPIYLLVRNVYLITTNNFDLFIQASFYIIMLLLLQYFNRLALLLIHLLTRVANHLFFKYSKLALTIQSS